MTTATTLFHGSVTDNIETLEPRLRFTPSATKEESAPSAIYASDLPAFSAAHAFPWSSDEGVDLFIEEMNKVVLIVPKHLAERLSQPVYIYEVQSSSFQEVTSDPCGHNFRSLASVKCIAKRSFQTVTEAVTCYGGEVIIK